MNENLNDLNINMLLESGNYSKALETCITALKLDPINPYFWNYMSKAYRGLNDPKKAKQAQKISNKYFRKWAKKNQTQW